LKYGTILLCAAAFGLAGCNTAGTATAQSNAALASLSLSFRWCGASPEFKVGKVPAATKSLRFNMVDRQVPSYRHGGGEVPFTGRGQATVPCGALTGGYNGPTPPPPQVHDYEWTVTALDAGGNALAVGKAVRKFPE
jgi:phosphatidylethanolamine-binding protein (PEBP) family uncharacterized protein